MPARAARNALTRRLQVLDRNLPAAVQPGDAEAVHRSRVASRRLREALPVLHPPVDPRALRKSRRAVRGLTRLLGGVRELDVALSILDELSASHPDLSVGVAVARRLVEQQRLRRREEMLRGLVDLEPRKLRKKLVALSEMTRLPAVAERRARLHERLGPRVMGVAAAMENAGSLYAFDRLHRVRIAIKKLRYLLELVHEVAGIGTRRLVRRLKSAQDLLGRLHDLEVLAGFARAALAAHPAHAIQLRTLLDLVEGETRQRHAQYLRLVPRLAAVLEACRTDLDRRLDIFQGPERHK